MKKMVNKIILAAGLLLILTAATAQKNSPEKNDRLIFLSGIIKQGKVLEFAGEKIKFVYAGETLNYEFKKTEIEKIEYASGRTEIITERKQPEAIAAPIATKNRVAIIPMQYTGNNNNYLKEDMGFYLQQIAITYLNSSAAELKFIDAANINALLLKNGIADSSIRKYTPKELAALLHVEYIIMGSVLQENGNVVTTANGSSRNNVQQYYGEGNYSRKGNFSESVVTNQHIDTYVYLSIYNEVGENIYSKSRHSILSEKDAYKNALQYLLKRTPIYKR